MIASAMLAMQVLSSSAAVPPSTKWGVDYGEDRCVITRSFTTAGESAILAIDANPVSGRGEMLLISPHIIKKSTRASAKVTVTPGAAELSLSWLATQNRDGTLTARLSVDNVAWPKILQATEMSVDGLSEGKIIIPLRGIDKAVEAAKVCGRALLRSWSADPDAMIEAPQGRNPPSWISYTDYPAEALRNNQQGIVKTITTVNAKGQPTACRTVVSSGFPALDMATCKAIMKRAHYDAADRETRYEYSRIAWLLP